MYYSHFLNVKTNLAQNVLCIPDTDDENQNRNKSKKDEISNDNITNTSEVNGDEVTTATSASVTVQC